MELGKGDRQWEQSINKSVLSNRTALVEGLRTPGTLRDPAEHASRRSDLRHEEPGV